MTASLGIRNDATYLQLENRIMSHMGQLESRLMRWMVSLVVVVFRG